MKLPAIKRYESVDMFLKKVCAKICPGKKVMGKKRSEISQFYRFLPIFQEAITFFLGNMPL